MFFTTTRFTKNCLPLAPDPSKVQKQGGQPYVPTVACPLLVFIVNSYYMGGVPAVQVQVIVIRCGKSYLKGLLPLSPAASPMHVCR